MLNTKVQVDAGKKHLETALRLFKRTQVPPSIYAERYQEKLEKTLRIALKLSQYHKTEATVIQIRDALTYSRKLGMTICCQDKAYRQLHSMMDNLVEALRIFSGIPKFHETLPINPWLVEQMVDIFPRASNQIIQAEDKLVTDLGADELGILELLLRIENELQIKVSDTEFISWKTAGHIDHFMEQHIKEVYRAN